VVAGAVGVIFSLGGYTRLNFTSRLGIETNNQAKAYALLQGLTLARKQVLGSISILGDSKGVIHHVRRKKFQIYMKLIKIFTRIHNELEDFHSFPFHVLRHNNSKEDF
jgi:ribonuclease HI